MARFETEYDLDWNINIKVFVFDWLKEFSCSLSVFNQYIGIIKQWIIDSYQFVIFCNRRYLEIWWWRNQCWFDSLKSKGFCFEHESGWCMLSFKYPFLFWAISKLIPIFCKDKLSISNLMSSFTRSHYCQQLPDQNLYLICCIWK